MRLYSIAFVLVVTIAGHNNSGFAGSSQELEPVNVQARILLVENPGRLLGKQVAAPEPEFDVSGKNDERVAAFEASPWRTLPLPISKESFPTVCGSSEGCTSTMKDRVAALEVRTELVLEKPNPTFLTLKLRYRDGIVVRLNGNVIARRNISLPQENEGPGQFTKRAYAPSGLEWEILQIPLSPSWLNKNGKNELLFSIKPSSVRLSVFFDFSLSGGWGASLARGPILQRARNNEVTLVFETDMPALGRVEYWQDSSKRIVTSAQGTLAKRHEVVLQKLIPGKTLKYQVFVNKAPSKIYEYTVAPSGGGPWSFGVYGDMRGGHEVHKQILNRLLEERPQFVVVTGDIVHRGHDEGDWQKFFDVAGELLAAIPYYVVSGNHDVGFTGEQRRRMKELFALWPAPRERPPEATWYSFTVLGIHFIVLDSNQYQNPLQLVWLKQDLGESVARKDRAVIALTHDGPYSRGPHGGNATAVRDYVPILEQAHVSGLFSGHDHLYQRGRVRGLPYVVSGGGGAPLYNIRCGKRGKPRCKKFDGMQFVKKAYHYVMVEVQKDNFRLCAKSEQGLSIEPCQTWPLRKVYPIRHVRE